MTRQERIDFMLAELGEGWKDAERFYPVVKRGPVLLQHTSAGYCAQVEGQPWPAGLESKGRAQEPRQAVDQLVEIGRKFLEDHTATLRSVEAARGWAQ